MCAQTVLVLLNLHFCMQKNWSGKIFCAEALFAVSFVRRPAALSPDDTSRLLFGLLIFYRLVLQDFAGPFFPRTSSLVRGRRRSKG